MTDLTFIRKTDKEYSNYASNQIMLARWLEKKSSVESA